MYICQLLLNEAEKKPVRLLQKKIMGWFIIHFLHLFGHQQLF